MNLLIEGYPYPIEALKELFPNVDELDVVDGVASVNYVGYYYYAEKGHSVFILPKVVIDQNNDVFGIPGRRPEDIIRLTDPDNPLTESQRSFIYGLSVWIYRAIAVYRDNCIHAGKDRTIIRQQNVIKLGKGKRRTSNTFLDILLSLIDFNKQNQDWFMFILKNIHSGFNKINWNRTIARSQVVVQNDEPIYLNPVTKKRQINFDEELLVIFYSILNYIREEYGFPIKLNVNYELITGKRFKRYLPHKREDGTTDPGFGVRRLRQIKYKYFSDKALQLWDLCFAFFDQSKQIKINSQINEFLLAKNFNIVFEAIIDDLIGDKKFPDKLNKNQEDGKEVDHMFLYNSVTTEETDKKTYYLGDSKYYRQKNEITKESVAKQYTYARNVIQWNLNLFFGENADPTQTETDFCLRDDVTEGYNIIPNFFISATVPDSLSYSDDQITDTKRKNKVFVSQQFRNRLFDRDTLLITHYDVNFLFVVSLYARNNLIQKKNWQKKVREIFRKKIQEELNARYNFQAMRAKPGVNTREFIETHFKDILGKVIAPFSDRNLVALALDNGNQLRKAIEEETNEIKRLNKELQLKELIAENERTKELLEQYFEMKDFKLGEDASSLLPPPSVEPAYIPGTSKRGVLMVMLMNYDSKYPNFAREGKIAIPVIYTKNGMEILENLESIGSVLFHTWNVANQHLFATIKKLSVVPRPEVPENYYIPRNPNKPADIPEEVEFLYILADLDFNDELDSSALDCRKRPAEVQRDAPRYEAQYSTLDELQVI
ncbi:MAG: restriction endonuclease [Muribaculaceae bacterium]|nr:restriction endonuclease [Muribaculaceae bacterium]